METATAPGIAQDCPCQLTTCAIWGNCVECVRGHRTNQNHLPECMQPMLRDLVTRMAQIVEFGVTEARPTPGK